MAHEQLHFGSWMILVFCLALTGIAAVQSFIFSRHIAGPIFAMTRHLEKCDQDKKYVPIHLREADLFQDLANRLNQVLEKVEQK